MIRFIQTNRRLLQAALLASQTKKTKKKKNEWDKGMMATVKANEDLTTKSKSPSPKRHHRFRLAPVVVLAVIVFFTFGSEFLELDRLETNQKGNHAKVKVARVTARNSSKNSGFNNNNNNSSSSSNAMDTMNHTHTRMETLSTKPLLTLLVMLSGEFGNNMFKIIRGWGTARLAEQEFGLATRIVFAEQRSRGRVIPKAKRTTKNVQKCMLSRSLSESPSYNISTQDFELGNRLLDEGYFHEIQSIPGTNFTLSGESRIGDIRNNLGILSNYLKDNPELVVDNDDDDDEEEAFVPKLMVRVNTLNVYPIVNEFYDEIRETFVFDEKCCGKTLTNPPGNDESVLYLRNYATEIRKEKKRRAHGFEELDSDRLVSQVLGHLKPGDKLALAGRNLKSDSQYNNNNNNNKTTQAYGIVSALEAMNLTLRFTPGTDEMEDFCFLRRTKKELIGNPASTYFELAAVLAGPSLKLTREYQYVTPELRNKTGSKLDEFRRSVGSNWTHPELRSRIRFEEYF